MWSWSLHYSYPIGVHIKQRRAELESSSKSVQDISISELVVSRQELDAGHIGCQHTEYSACMKGLAFF